MAKKNWRHCDLHDKWYDGDRFDRCYSCSQVRNYGACIECGYRDCKGLCLDIALERARGIRDY